MLGEIILDRFDSISATNQPIFRTDIDYDALVSEREKIVQKWQSLDSEKRKLFPNQGAFETSEGAPNLKDPDLIPAKNLSLIRKEIKERLNSHNTIQLLPVETLDFDDSLLELAESIENSTEIRDLYKLRKMTTGNKKNSGINLEEAARLKNCFSQGRELYIAGKQGSLMVKPLNFFYAVTAYTYGIIILNNPLRYGKGNIPGSHGMSYLPDSIQAQFGGDSARGTFSDLVTAFPTQIIKSQNIEFNIDCTDSLIKFYEIRHSVSLGTLLSMIPEMTEYYKLTTGSNSRCHPIEITNANDPRSLTWEFHIGDGDVRPDIDGIENAFSGLVRAERQGKIVITVPASKATSIKACIYTDIRGKLWYIDNPFYPVILPEIATHFLINSIFSNIMRYRPDEWGSVILNDVSSNISLITRHYFSSFQRKFFLVILRSLSRYIPYAT
jgi:hypothetical protein